MRCALPVHLLSLCYSRLFYFAGFMMCDTPFGLRAAFKVTKKHSIVYPTWSMLFLIPQQGWGYFLIVVIIAKEKLKFLLLKYIDVSLIYIAIAWSWIFRQFYQFIFKFIHSIWNKLEINTLSINWMFALELWINILSFLILEGGGAPVCRLWICD